MPRIRQNYNSSIVVLFGAFIMKAAWIEDAACSFFGVYPAFIVGLLLRFGVFDVVTVFCLSCFLVIRSLSISFI